MRKVIYLVLFLAIYSYADEVFIYEDSTSQYSRLVDGFGNSYSYLVNIKHCHKTEVKNKKCPKDNLKYFVFDQSVRYRPRYSKRLQVRNKKLVFEKLRVLYGKNRYHIDISPFRGLGTITIILKGIDSRENLHYLLNAQSARDTYYGESIPVD